MLLPDTPEFLYCFFGAIKIGAVAVPTNTLLKPHEYEYLLNDTHARIAIVSEILLPEFAVTQLKVEEILVMGHGLCGGCAAALTGQFDDSEPGEGHFIADWVGMLSGARNRVRAHHPKLDRAAPTSKDDPAFWLYSSGSTATPKGCVHLHHDMVVCSELYAKAILRINEHDRCYSVAKLFFAYGLGNAGYFPLAVGATSILSPHRPTPENVYADIERYRPTLFFSVPTNYAALLAHHRDDGREFDLSSIRHAVSAGEPLPAALFERFTVYLQSGLVSVMLVTMVLSFSIGPGFEAALLRSEIGRGLPPVWFLGLYQEMLGDPDPLFATLAARAPAQ